MEAAFDSLAFALFLEAHLLAAIALTGRTHRARRDGTPRALVVTLEHREEFPVTAP